MKTLEILQYPGEMIVYKQKVLSHFSNMYKWSNTSYQIKIKHFHSISTLQITLVEKVSLEPKYLEFSICDILDDLKKECNLGFLFVFHVLRRNLK